MSQFDFSCFPVLTTDRLRLRELDHGDAEAVMAIFGSPEVLRFLNLPPVDSREKAIEMLNRLNKDYQDHVAVEWGITLVGDDRLIGVCGCYAWDRENRHADIGYHLLPSHWGKGYATEAARAMIRWCFANLDLHRVEADCTDGHTASERVLLNCGFKVEGLWRDRCWEHGRFVNIKQFGLLRQEFA